jgi:hypothetical protein
MVALKRTLFALALVVFGCGDDDDGKTSGTRLDGGVDSGLMSDGSIATTDATTPVAPDASTPGTPTTCAATTAATATMCGGLHCGETPAELKAGRTAGACTTDAESESLCSLKAVNEVRACATMHLIDTAGRNACAMTKLPELSSGCLDCFLAGAQCAQDKCFSECATGNIVACDTCRVQMGCVAAFYTCAGFRNPLQR